MTKKVTIVDYNVGNLFSLAQALQYCGAEVVLAETGREIESAERLILPGVGAFPFAMSELLSRRLLLPIQEYCATERLFLGICVGMQMMTEIGEEFKETEGLGVIPGRVGAIPNSGSDGQPHKIPHIGWNSLNYSSDCTGWQGTILADTEPGAYVYFVHSFTMYPLNQRNRLADCDYDGQIISAVVQSDNRFGCQFHPEKSGPTGLKILQRFLEM